jgi:hypothetical protein
MKISKQAVENLQAADKSSKAQIVGNSKQVLVQATGRTNLTKKT